MINEKLLHFIWQFRYFNQTKLYTVDGKEVAVLYPGIINKNQGPDFSEAKIKIENTLWAGNIELHILSSDWRKHNHTGDNNYSNIILHVVWKHDEEIKDANNQTIATVELQQYVSKLLLQKYERLMQADDFVACRKHLPILNEIGWIAWKERLVAERLQNKSLFILEYLNQAQNNWEETFWWVLAKAFGTKVNGECFLQIAKSVPVKILAKHKNNIHQLEALLLGQAGLLEKKFDDDYAIMLTKEYKFLSKKYNLQPVQKQAAFLRMRPANFPTLRLAQLAALINQSSHLFSKIKLLEHPAHAEKLFDITANDYWHYHYMFDDEKNYRPKSVGSSFIHGIIINTIIPVYFAYGLVNNDNLFKLKAINWLTLVKPEQNNITKGWQACGIENPTALDSQALIELKNNYCNYKRCLDCAVGNKLLGYN